MKSASGELKNIKYFKEIIDFILDLDHIPV